LCNDSVAHFLAVAALKDRLRAVLTTKGTAVRQIRDVAYHIYAGNKQVTHEQLQQHTLNVLKTVYLEKRINKQRAVQIFGEREYADVAMNYLRQLDIIKVEGSRRGAVYVFSDHWVYHDHEVVGA
jgi:hypothetical protein